MKTVSPYFYNLLTYSTVVKMDYSNFYKTPTRLGVIKTDSPNFYNLITYLPTSTSPLHARRWSKHSPNFYKPPTRLAVVKAYSANFYNLLAYFTVVKTDPSNFYEIPTRLSVVKPDSLNFYESDYTLGSGQNALSILLQAFNKFGKMGSNSHLQASYTLSCGQN